MTFKTKTKAEFALFIAVLLWGLTFPFVRIVIAEITPLHLLFVRGTIASLIFLPFILFIKSNKNSVLKLLPMGCILGLLYFLAYYTQSMGLLTINSGRSAFITNLSVIFVPLLSPLFKRGIPSKNDIISCCIATVGMYFLTDPFHGDGINIGDLYTIGTAICFSFQIHILHHALDKNNFPIIYAFWQVVFISIFSIMFIPILHAHSSFIPSSTAAIWALIYLAVIVMVVSTWLQTRYQNKTTPERAVIIYIIEPVFACIFGYLILNEKMSLINLFGGTLIILSVLWHNILSLFRGKNVSK